MSAIIALAAAAWLGVIAAIMNVENVRSMLLFKVAPALLALGLAADALGRAGWWQ
jgi:hypothetical protein